MRQHSAGFVGGINIPICQYGDGNSINYGGYGVVLRAAFEAIGAGAAVNSKQLHAGLLGNTRNGDSILRIRINTGADL